MENKFEGWETKIFFVTPISPSLTHDTNAEYYLALPLS